MLECPKCGKCTYSPDPMGEIVEELGFSNIPFRCTLCAHFGSVQLPHPIQSESPLRRYTVIYRCGCQRSGLGLAAPLCWEHPTSGVDADATMKLLKEQAAVILAAYDNSATDGEVAAIDAHMREISQGD